MNLFFYDVNNNNMKKILLIIILFSVKVKAIENIDIDNNHLSPSFSKEYKKYNYYTDKKAVRINVKNSSNEKVTGEGVHYLEEGINKVIIKSSNGEEYEINIYKDYEEDNNLESKLLSLTIDGYDISFDSNIHEYTIVINDEKNLLIDYKLSNDNTYVSITGNGNFNKSDNIIKISVDNKEEYIIHVLKTKNVSKVEEVKEYKEMSSTKKEIVALIIITISCILVFLFYYVLFINKTSINI